MIIIKHHVTVFYWNSLKTQSFDNIQNLSQEFQRVTRILMRVKSYLFAYHPIHTRIKK